MEKIKKVNNSLFKERFQFLLYANENVICQRYFRVNNFDYSSIESLELKKVMDECVEMIKNDLTEKSRTYLWYTDKSPIKMNGFCFDENLTTEDVFSLTNGKSGTVTLSNSATVKKDYFDYYSVANEQEEYKDERPNDWETVFKFVFIMDDKVLYEQLWDANVYPKYIRNSVDLSNSNAFYKNRDPLTLSFALSLIYHLTNGKRDLVYHIIKKICDTLSASYCDEFERVKKTIYNNRDKNGNVVASKTYYCSTVNKENINGWKNATLKKTKDYFNSLYPSYDKIKYIDKYL